MSAPKRPLSCDFRDRNVPSIFLHLIALSLSYFSVLANLASRGGGFARQRRKRTRSIAKLRLGLNNDPAILLYRDGHCRQYGRQQPSPIVEKANSDGRHETTRQKTNEQMQRLSQMIGIGVVQCATAF